MHEFLRISSSLSVLYVHGLSSRASGCNCMHSSSLGSRGKLVSDTLTPVEDYSSCHWSSIRLQHTEDIYIGADQGVLLNMQVCKECVHLRTAT